MAGAASLSPALPPQPCPTYPQALLLPPTLPHGLLVWPLQRFARIFVTWDLTKHVSNKAIGAVWPWATSRPLH